MNAITDIRDRVGEWMGAAREWLRIRPEDTKEIRPGICLRSALCAIALGSALQVSADVEAVTSSRFIDANDSVLWDSMGQEGTLLFNPTIWTTKSGMRFRISKPSDGAMRLSQQQTSFGRQLCVNTQNSPTIVMEFEHPISGVTAQVILNSALSANVTLKALDQNGQVLLQSSETLAAGTTAASQCMGANGSASDIKVLELSSDNGVISVGRIDLNTTQLVARSTEGQAAQHIATVVNNTVPAVTDQTFSIMKNGINIVPTPVLTIGTHNVASYQLVKEPKHAAYFHLFPDGTFSYRPETNYSGVDTFVYQGIGFDGRTTSLPGAVNINVNWVNSAPNFVGGPNQEVAQDSGPQLVKNWAVHMSAGAPDEELRQRLAWITNNDQPMLFSDQPSILPDGTLKYAIATHATGVANVTVWLKDDGGAEHGGIDTSDAYHFTITVNPIAHKPVLGDLPEQTVNAGEAMSLRATASLVDMGKVVIYGIENAPRGMNIDPLNGIIAWTPGLDVTPGAYDVTVKAGIAGMDQLVDRRVLRVNLHRGIDTLAIKPIAPQTIPAGSHLSIRVQAASTSHVQFLLGATTPGADLNSETGEFSWTPAASDAGHRHLFLVTAYDPHTGKTSSVNAFTIDVQTPAIAKAAIKSTLDKGSSGIATMQIHRARRSHRRSRSHRSSTTSKPTQPTASQAKPETFRK